MKPEERLRRPCPRNHPLSGRYIEPRLHDKKHPRGCLRCRHCDADGYRRHRRERSLRLPMAIILCFPDRTKGAKQIAKVLHHADARKAARWLDNHPAEPWEIRQVVAAMELGLISHQGIAPDAAILFDAEIDHEPTIEEKAKMRFKADENSATPCGTDFGVCGAGTGESVAGAIAA